MPKDYITLGYKLIEARDYYEQLRDEYKAQTIELSKEIFLSALAENSPYPYGTLRRWITETEEEAKAV